MASSSGSTPAGPPYPWEPPTNIHWTPSTPKRWQVLSGRYLCAMMWFWMMYRLKEDGDVLLGFRHKWEPKGGKHH